MITIKDGLYQYKGGGYDGCFWEWNYCAIWENEFYDIASSGRNAIKSESDLIAYDDTLYYYEFTPESLKEFANESNVIHVLGVSTVLYDKFGIEIWADCTHCGNEFFVYNGFLESFSGCGGIAIQANDLICPDCDSFYTCESCNEWNSSTEYSEKHDLSLCEFCLESMDEKLEKDQKEWFESSINHIAFSNGHVLSCNHGDSYCVECHAVVDYESMNSDEKLHEICPNNPNFS